MLRLGKNTSCTAAAVEKHRSDAANHSFRKQRYVPCARARARRRESVLQIGFLSRQRLKSSGWNVGQSMEDGEPALDLRRQTGTRFAMLLCLLCRAPETRPPQGKQTQSRRFAAGRNQRRQQGRAALRAPAKHRHSAAHDRDLIYASPKAGSRTL